MFSRDEVERLRHEVADLGRYSVHIAIVLSVVFSLSAVVILSKRHLANEVWEVAAIFAVPMPIAWYFRNRIALLGVFAYVTALIVALISAILFGI